MVSVDANRHSVPDNITSRVMTVYIGPSTLRLHDEADNLIATHPRLEGRHGSRTDDLCCRKTFQQPGRPQDAPCSGSTSPDRPVPGTGRDHGLRSHRPAVAGGMHEARIETRGRGPADFRAAAGEDTRKLRLHLPAFPRPRQDHGPGRTVLHRTGRGGPSAGSPGNRQDPSGHRNRCCRHQGRQACLPDHPCGFDRQPDPGRTGRTVQTKMRSHVNPSLLIVDEIGFLPIAQGGASLFFQLVNAHHGKGGMILTSNLGFADWGGGDVRRHGHGNGTSGSPSPSFGGDNHNRSQLPAEGTHGADPGPCQDQQVTDPATGTREKGTAQKK